MCEKGKLFCCQVVRDKQGSITVGENCVQLTCAVFQHTPRNAGLLGLMRALPTSCRLSTRVLGWFLLFQLNHEKEITGWDDFPALVWWVLLLLLHNMGVLLQYFRSAFYVGGLCFVSFFCINMYSLMSLSFQRWRHFTLDFSSHNIKQKVNLHMHIVCKVILKCIRVVPLQYYKICMLPVL